jgi:hypothetical protein
VSVEDRSTVCAKHTIGLEIVLDALGYSLVTWVMLNHVLVHLETMLVSVQDRRMVGAKRTIGSGIILDALDSTPK